MYRNRKTRLRFAIAIGAWIGTATVSVCADPLSLSVTKAQATIDPGTGLPVLNLELTPDSRTAFGMWTKDLVGKQITVNIDGIPVISPVVQEPILAGKLQISGDSSMKQLQDWAQRIAAGQSKIAVDLKKD